MRRRNLQEQLLTKTAVVLCISNSATTLCHVVGTRRLLRVWTHSAQLPNQCCASKRVTRCQHSAEGDSHWNTGEAVEDCTNTDHAG